MPTIVGILTFISMINTTSERLKAINFFSFSEFFSFYEQLKFRTRLSWAWKKFYNFGASMDAEADDLYWCQYAWKPFSLGTAHILEVFH